MIIDINGVCDISFDAVYICMGSPAIIYLQKNKIYRNTEVSTICKLITVKQLKLLYHYCASVYLFYQNMLLITMIHSKSVDHSDYHANSKFNS